MTAVLSVLHPLQISTLVAALPAGWAAALLIRREAGTRTVSAIAMIAACLVLAAWSWRIMPDSFLLPLTFALGWSLLVLASVDALAFRLPDILTLPLAAIGLAASFWLPDAAPLAHFIGAAAGFIVLYAIAVLYRRVRGREGLGLGDAKLVAAAGAWLGWAALPSLILIGCAAAFLWIGLAVFRRGREAMHEQIPFGVPLCFAFWIVWLYGPLGL